MKPIDFNRTGFFRRFVNFALCMGIYWLLDLGIPKLFPAMKGWVEFWAWPVFFFVLLKIDWPIKKQTETTR